MVKKEKSAKDPVMKIIRARKKELRDKKEAIKKRIDYVDWLKKQD